MSEDPFSDPPTILEPPARGRTKTRPSNQEKMDQEIQEIRIVEPGRKASRSVAGTGAAPPPVPPKKQRSLSQDGVLQAAAAMTNKTRSGANGSKPGKKGGLHVDVIDRLDYSGVGPATFHHDGPFDACAPSRNRNRNKAPMLAWAPGQEEKSTEDAGVVTDGGAILTAKSVARDSPYSAAALSAKTTKQNKHRSQDPYEYPRRPASPKRRDTLADAWGKGEPEPFEEFFAPSINPAAVGHGENGTASAASSIYKDREGHGSSASKKRTNGGVRKPTNRPPLPPPQPIFPESAQMNDDAAIYATQDLSPGGGPQRSKSIMQRIKKMRDAPNVPVDYDDNANDGSSSENHAARPTHRSQGSYLGRLGNRSPTSPGFGGDTTGEKGLPSLPPSSSSPKDELGSAGYFERGLGRKTSIMQRVRGVVVGKNK